MNEHFQFWGYITLTWSLIALKCGRVPPWLLLCMPASTTVFLGNTAVHLEPDQDKHLAALYSTSQHYTGPYSTAQHLHTLSLSYHPQCRKRIRTCFGIILRQELTNKETWILQFNRTIMTETDVLLNVFSILLQLKMQKVWRNSDLHAVSQNTTAI